MRLLPLLVSFLFVIACSSTPDNPNFKEKQFNPNTDQQKTLIHSDSIQTEIDKAEANLKSFLKEN